MSRCSLNIQESMNKKAELFWQGEFDRLTEVYDFPIPVYVGETLTSYDSPDAITGVLSNMRADMLADGLTSVQARVVAQDLPRNGQYRVFVDWHYCYEDNDTRETTSVTYFFRETIGGPKVQMVEFRKCDHSDVSTQGSPPTTSVEAPYRNGRGRFRRLENYWPIPGHTVQRNVTP